MVVAGDNGSNGAITPRSFQSTFEDQTMLDSPYISLAVFKAILPVPLSDHRARALIRGTPGLSISIGGSRYVLRTAAVRVAQGLDALLNAGQAYDYAMKLRPFLVSGAAPEIIDAIGRMTDDDRIDPAEIRAELAPFARDEKSARRLASHRTYKK